LLFDGKYGLDIWKAFAKRGLGYSANKESNNNTTDGTPAYDLPTILPVTFSSSPQKNKAALPY
jgi:hypothetical protein